MNKFKAFVLSSLITACSPNLKPQDDCRVYGICDDHAAGAIAVLSGDDDVVAGEETMAGEEVVAGEETMAGEEVVAGEETMAGEQVVAGEETMAGEEVVAGEETMAGEEVVAGVEIVVPSCNDAGDTVCINRIDCVEQAADSFFEEAQMQMICLRITAVEDATIPFDYNVNVFSQLPQNVSVMYDGEIIHSNVDSSFPVKGGQFFNSSQELFLEEGTHTLKLMHQTSGEQDQSLPINFSDSVNAILNIANSSYQHSNVYSSYDDRAYVTVFEEDGIQKAEITNGSNSATNLYMLLRVYSFVEFDFTYKFAQDGVELIIVQNVQPGLNTFDIPQFDNEHHYLFSFDIPQEAFYIEINPTNSYIGFDDYIKGDFGYFGNPIKLIWDSLDN